MRILVAENDPSGARTRRLLEEEGFQVEAARDGVHLLHALEAAQYDLILLDLDLPPDCFTVLRRLVRAHPRLPVVVVSTHSDLATKLLCFELGAGDYLVKPYPPEELVARIRAQLRTIGGSVGVLKVGQLALDMTARQARIGRRVVDLSEREFQLLHCFVRHAGQVMAREQLLAEVWQRAADSGSNVVEACVLRLRNKLGPTVPIKTVRGAGYQLPVRAQRGAEGARWR